MKRIPVCILYLISSTIISAMDQNNVDLSVKRLVSLLGFTQATKYIGNNRKEWNTSIPLPDNTIIQPNGSKKSVYTFIQELEETISERNILLYIGSLLLNKELYAHLACKKAFAQSYAFHMSLTGHENSISAFALDEEKRALFAGDYNLTIMCWDLDTYACKYTLGKHKGFVEHLAIDPNHNLLSASYDKKVKWWDTEQQSCITTLKHPDNTSDVAFVTWHPERNVIVYALTNQTIRIFNPHNQRYEPTICEHEGGLVTTIIFDTESNTAISGTWNTNCLQFTDTNNNTVAVHAHKDQIRAIYKQPHASYIYSGSHDNTVKQWDTATHTCTKTYVGSNNGILSVTYDPKHDFVIAGAKQGEIHIWDACTTEHLMRVLIPTLQDCNHISAVSCDTQTNTIVAGSYSGAISICKPTLEDYTHMFHCTPTEYMLLDHLFIKKD